MCLSVLFYSFPFPLFLSHSLFSIHITARLLLILSQITPDSTIINSTSTFCALSNLFWAFFYSVKHLPGHSLIKGSMFWCIHHCIWVIHRGNHKTALYTTMVQWKDSCVIVIFGNSWQTPVGLSTPHTYLSPLLDVCKAEPLPPNAKERRWSLVFVNL